MNGHGKIKMETEERFCLRTVQQAVKAGIAESRVGAPGPEPRPLVLGLLQLTYPEAADSVSLWKIEGGLAAIATLLVIRGLVGHVHENWLKARLTAERLRLQIFGVFADPDFSTRGVPRNGWQRIEDNELKSWAEGGRIPAIPRPPVEAEGPSAPAAVARFYHRARLESQAAYFKSKEDSEKKRFWDDSALVQLVFFVSVVFALMHVLMHWAYTRQPTAEFHHVSVLLLLLSAAVPILFTGFRTWRSANESARNAARAHAKHSLLVNFQNTLDASKDSWSLFTTMQLAESVLEEEQREWLRLMDEAEWI